MTNPFTATGFDMAAMTAAVNKLPNLYNRTAAIFPESPINTTSVLVEMLNGTLNITSSVPRGAPAVKAKTDKRVLRSLIVPHIPLIDVVKPEEIQNVRAFGSETATETGALVLARKQQKLKNIIDQTREFHRIGALKGIILDGDGSTLYNLYTEFGITAATNPGDLGKYLTVDFALDVDTTSVILKCLDVKRHIEMNLRGESATGFRALVSKEFYNSLTTHPEVEKAYGAYMALNQSLGVDYRKGFTFGGITFEEYNASWTDSSSNVRVALAANQGIVFPEGTGNTFETVVAPGNYMETVNTMGVPYYSTLETMPHGQGYEVRVESNTLPICKRPEVLVTVTI